LSDVVVGLDIGTSRVRAVVGEISDSGVFQITGVGTSPSTGLRKGVVVNIENTVRAVSQAVEAAEMMSGIEASHCLIGIGGTHIDGLNSRGVVAVTGKGRDNREIGPEDINRVIDAAKAVVIPMDRQVIHVIPQSYIVDDQRGIKDPRNMIGVRMESEVHIITGSVTSVQNIVKCVNRASLAVDEYMYHALAAVKSVMTDDERELGSILIDIGGGTTDVVVMADGAPLFTSVLPVGGIQVTSDISLVKGVSLETAEKIKLDAGCCWGALVEDNEEGKEYTQDRAESETAHRSVCAKAAVSGVRSVLFFGSEIIEAARNTEWGAVKVYFLETIEEVIATLKEAVSEGDLVLVKGSRGMALERIMPALSERFQC
jgi:cell division protein FtsA